MEAKIGVVSVLGNAKSKYQFHRRELFIRLPNIILYEGGRYRKIKEMELRPIYDIETEECTDSEIEKDNKEDEENNGGKDFDEDYKPEKDLIIKNPFGDKSGTLQKWNLSHLILKYFGNYNDIIGTEEIFYRDKNKLNCSILNISKVEKQFPKNIPVSRYMPGISEGADYKSIKKLTKIREFLKRKLKKLREPIN